MSERAMPWYGLRGNRRVLTKALTLLLVVSAVAMMVMVALVNVASASLPVGGSVALMDPLTSAAVGFFGLWFIFALIGLIFVLVAWKGMNMKHKAIASVFVVALWGLVILGAAAMQPAVTSGGGSTGTPLQMVITPSVQTSEQIASPYTACTSQTPTTSNAAKTAAGYVWAAVSGGTGAVYNAAGPLSGQFLDQAGDQVAVTGGGGKLSANAGTCWEMKFIFAYTNAPPASGGGSVYFPVYVYLTGVSYSAPSANLNNQPFNTQYSNGTVVNVPIFASSLVGGGAFPVLAKDGAGNQQQVCSNLLNANVQFLSALPTCSGINVNQNPTTNSITFYVMVSTNSAGLFGYATSDAAVGSSLTLSFAIGLPQTQALPGYQGYYTPTLAQYTLTVQRTTA